ncbi:MAG: quinoprotein dehydrogenase-associated SoxYZ-like carrier [Pseudomonadota bacterium]
MIRAFRLAMALLLFVAVAAPAGAGGYRTVDWAELKAEIYGARAVLPAGDQVRLDAPRRSADDRRVPVDIAARLEDGALIRSVTVIIDENPMPVSARFDFPEPRKAVRLGVDMRLNGPSPVRAVVETADGRLLMTERLVKTSGLGACAAPPVGDPDAAIAAIGQMQAREIAPPEGMSRAARLIGLDLRHPQHTGLQMDQVTLHFILARFVEELTVSSAAGEVFTMTGSISLSEDPAIRFEIADHAAAKLRVRLRDTSDTRIERTLPIGPET